MATMYPLFLGLLLTAVCGTMGTGDGFIAERVFLRRHPGRDPGSLGSKQVQDLLSLPPMKSSCRKDAGTRKEQMLSRAQHDVQREIVSGVGRHTHTPHPASRTPHPASRTSHPETRTRIIQIASAEIGVREATGRNDGKRVEEYLQYTHLGKGHEWCAAFVSWCYGQAGLPQPRNPWSPALFPNAHTYYRDNACRSTAAANLYSIRTSVMVSLSNHELLWNIVFDRLRLTLGLDKSYIALATDVGERLQTRVRKPPKTGVPHPATANPADLFGIYGASAKRINHVGLVKAQQGQYLITIEGNSNNRVESRRRHLSTIYALSDWVTK